MNSSVDTNNQTHKNTSPFREDSFVQHLVNTIKSPKRGIGIGDDCAVLPIGHSSHLSDSDNDTPYLQLFTVDTLIEGTHFLRDKISAHDLGYKSVAVNLSDIAAMGGTAQYLLLSLALPKNISPDWPNEFIEGVKECSDQFQVHLVGGDTVKSPSLISITVTAIGNVTQKNLKTRKTASSGDIVCVTKTLGDSHMGFKALTEDNLFKQWQNANSENNVFIQDLIERHQRPMPELTAGTWLGQQTAVHAMMDLSDGLKIDLLRMAQASQCKIEIELEKLPVSPALQKISAITNEDALEIAATGGEDYALLCTIAAEQFSQIQILYRQKFQREIYPIGLVTDSKNQPEITFKKNNQIYELKYQPFEHF